MIRCLLSVWFIALAAPLLAQDAPGAAVGPRPVVTEVVAPRSGLASAWVGTVAARTELDLGFTRLGTLAERPVDLGDLVARGQLLARIDPGDLDAALRSAEAGVSVSEAQLRTAQDVADRATALVARGVDSESLGQSADRALAAAVAQVAQARAALAQARDARSYADLTAPSNGVITAVAAEPGDTVDAGAAVLRLATTEAREVGIDLQEGDVADLERGAQFRVRLQSNPDITAEAVLRAVDAQAARATRSRRAHLTLAADAAAAFRLGALVLVQPVVADDARITLPTSALIDGSAPPQVWRVDPQGRTVARVPVTTGPDFAGRILILSGVAVGDEIVTKGVNSLQDGQAVGPGLTQ